MHQPIDNVRTSRDRVVAATLGLGPFLANFDVTSVVVAMPAIRRDLGFGIGALPWVIDAYSIAFTAMLLVAGSLSDRMGRLRSLIAGNAIFLLASAGCGIASNVPLFLASRAIQGCGAAFVVTGALALVGATFIEANARARALGVVGIVSGAAMALGPSLGGMISSTVGWRWLFLANIPFCLLLSIVAPKMVTETRGTHAKSLDWLGVVLLMAALAFVIDGTLAARHSLIQMAIEVSAGAALAAVFIARQRRQENPLVEPSVFAGRAMVGVAGLLMAVSAGYWSVLVYLPLFLSAKFGWTAEANGLALLAATAPMILIPSLGARVVTVLGWRHFFAVAMTSIVLGGSMLCLAAVAKAGSIAIATSFAGMLLIGIGAALSHPQLSGAAMTLAPANVSGMASAVTVIARQTGFAIGVAALGALTPVEPGADGFVRVFASSAFAAACGLWICFLLPRSKRD